VVLIDLLIAMVLVKSWTFSGVGLASPVGMQDKYPPFDLSLSAVMALVVGFGYSDMARFAAIGHLEKLPISESTNRSTSDQ
jgi:hypothetical protein